jgi:hypothetical protein
MEYRWQTKVRQKAFYISFFKVLSGLTRLTWTLGPTPWRHIGIESPRYLWESWVSPTDNLNLVTERNIPARNRAPVIYPSHWTVLVLFHLRKNNFRINKYFAIFCWWNFRFSRRRVWRWLSSRVLRRVVCYKFTDVSEVLAASITGVHQPRRQSSSYFVVYYLFPTTEFMSIQCGPYTTDCFCNKIFYLNKLTLRQRGTESSTERICNNFSGRVN